MVRQAIGDETIERLRARLHGNLILPGDATYDDARTVWNGMIDKGPGLVARCEGTADVITAVNVARENDHQVAVRGGDHNVAGTAVCDGGLVVDRTEMTGLWVDPEERTAWVQGGATWADVDHETQAFGLATPGGVVSKTGVAGLSLGGGIGHLRCKYGLACDNLTSVDVVTADGDFLTASKDENPESFWGPRGGGGNFGIVTGFEFELHPVGPEVATCYIFHSGDQLEECPQAYLDCIAWVPEEVSTLTSAGVMNDEDLFSAAVRDDLEIGFLGCYAGPPEDGEAVLAPLRDLGETIVDFSGTMAYERLVALEDEYDPTNVFSPNQNVSPPKGEGA